MNLEELIQRAVEISRKYDELNGETFGRPWNEQELMAGFASDVGGLSKAVMAKQGLRKLDNIDERLTHKLADCLWSILVLSSKYDIDIGEEFTKTMDMLESRINQEMSP
jgi:NTP pyrophosphatase (non-canonical NTP hydrolase)